MKRNTLIIFLLVILSLLIILLYKNKEVAYENKTYSVVLTKNGFLPSELNIRQDDIVVFSTDLDSSFWPASDLHPTHGIYPEFDPRKPIESGNTWSFKFEKVGNWRFHDHLNSLYIGTINVKGNSTAKINDCSNPNSKIECWQKELNTTLEKKGLPKTFDLMAELYSKEPLFASECHSFAHEIGKFAYSKFKAGENFELNSKTSYCGYGFYHGFMETLLQTTGDIKQAKDFCKYVGVKLSKETTDGERACYHGIGHGAVDGGDPTSWGNAQKMINPSLKLCEQVAGDDRSQYGKLYRCVSGVYNAIEILSNDPKYKLDKVKTDPFSLCLSQKDEYKQACYTNMIPAILRITSNDLIKSEKYIENISDKDFTFKSPIVSDLFHEFIRLNIQKPDYNKDSGINECHSLKDPYRLSCIEGISGGFMKYGEPGKAYIKGLNFCASSNLLSDEKEICYKSILSRLLIWYSQSKSREICESIPTEFKKYCNQI